MSRARIAPLEVAVSPRLVAPSWGLRASLVLLALVLVVACGCRGLGDRESVSAWPLVAADRPRENIVPNASGPFLRPVPGTSDSAVERFRLSDETLRVDPITGLAPRPLEPDVRASAHWPLDRYYELDPARTEMRVDALGNLVRSRSERYGPAREFGFSPLFYYRNDPAQDHELLHVLWPLVKYERTARNERFWLLPLIYYNRFERPDGSIDLDAFVFPLIFFGTESIPADDSKLRELFWRDQNRDGVLSPEELEGIDTSRWQLTEAGELTWEEAKRDPELVQPPRTESYFAAFPFGGTIRGLLYDYIEFYLFPLYYHHVDRGFRSYYAPWPIVHWGHGAGRRSFHIMPFYAKDVRRELVRDPETGEMVEGPIRREAYSVMWPLVQWQNVYGTLNVSEDPSQPDFQRVPVMQSRMFFPFYMQQKTLSTTTTSVLWPLFGVEERPEDDYIRVDAPWPIFRYARGRGEHELRIWPLFHEYRLTRPEFGHEQYRLSMLWPLIWYDRDIDPFAERERLKVLPFFYWDRTRYRDSIEGLPAGYSEMIKFWPLFGYRRQRDGTKQIEILSPLPPLDYNHIPGFEQNWATLWRLFYWERSGDGDYLRWNALGPLIRYEEDPTGRSFDFFPLLQHRAGWTKGPYPVYTESWDILYGFVGWGTDEIGDYLRLLWAIKIRLNEKNRLSTEEK